MCVSAPGITRTGLLCSPSPPSSHGGRVERYDTSVRNDEKVLVQELTVRNKVLHCNKEYG